MKTPEEIKKGLEFCSPKWMGDHWKSCDNKCPYQAENHFCKNVLNRDTKEYIQQLEAANTELLTRVEQLTAKCHQLERERDAAVKDIHKTCSTCKHYYYNRQDDDTADCLWFDGCKNEDHWQWRGAKEE